MSRPAIKWGQVVRYCNKHGYEIRPGRGGEKTIYAPKNDGAQRTRQQLRIGHKFCGHAGSELIGAYVSKLRNTFGIDIDELSRS